MTAIQQRPLRNTSPKVGGRAFHVGHNPQIVRVQNKNYCRAGLSLNLLEIKIFEIKMNFDDTSRFHSGTQYILLGGDIAWLR